MTTRDRQERSSWQHRLGDEKTRRTSPGRPAGQFRAMIWRCPLHHGLLAPLEGALIAECCGGRFPVVAGIPDLRVGHPDWLDHDKDRYQAETLSAAVPPEDVAGSVEWVFRQRPSWSETMVAHRTSQVLGASDRLRLESSQWLAPLMRDRDLLLDLGCGPGMLLAAIGNRRRVAGLDVSLEWLIVAQRLARAAGVEPDLAAGHAESLPLADESVGAVAALDVLEHVGDQASMLREIDRVLRPGGQLAAATPNRFSLAAEPHVHVWGVGFLSRAWQEKYVEWRTGLPYRFTKLHSWREVRALVTRHTGLHVEIAPPPVPGCELDRFSPRRRVLATAYNHLLRRTTFRLLAREVGPFFHIHARKPVRGPLG